MQQKQCFFTDKPIIIICVVYFNLFFFRRRGERRHRNLWDVGPEDAEKLGLLSNLPINIGSDGDFMHADRAGRRIYVGNLPLDAKESEVRDFFNAVMIAAGVNMKNSY